MVVVGGDFGCDLLDRQAAGTVPGQVAFRSGDGLGGAQAAAIVGVGFADRRGYAEFAALNRGKVACLVVAVGGDLPEPFLHPVVLGVGDPDVPGGIDGDALRSGELAVVVAGAAELGEVFAFGAEALGAVVLGVGDPELSFGVEGEAVGVGELAVAGAGDSDLAGG